MTLRMSGCWRSALRSGEKPSFRHTLALAYQDGLVEASGQRCKLCTQHKNILFVQVVLIQWITLYLRRSPARLEIKFLAYFTDWNHFAAAQPTWFGSPLQNIPAFPPAGSPHHNHEHQSNNQDCRRACLLSHRLAGTDPQRNPRSSEPEPSGFRFLRRWQHLCKLPCRGFGLQFLRSFLCGTHPGHFHR